MKVPNLQKVFFQQIKNIAPANISLVEEIANILNISNDSAYRRIRGEKQMSFEEIQKLAVHFKVSLDQILHLREDSFIFNGRFINSSDFTYKNWLQTCIVHLEQIDKSKPKHLFYLAKEIPFYYYFLFPEIAAFKSYFFMKSILYYEEYKSIKFSINDDYNDYLSLWERASRLYANIPSTEIWHIENITSTLHQIEFYNITGSFKSNVEATCLIDKLHELINHIEIQAEHGVKLAHCQQPYTSGINFQMFTNELLMGDNMQLVQMGNIQLTYINHSIMNFVATTDAVFNENMKKTMEHITQKSIPISGVNEKDRILFFNKLRKKINEAKARINT